MASPHPVEILAIRKLRDTFPDMAQRRLARRIEQVNFTKPENRTLAQTASLARTFLSIYSVIRRYDKSKAVSAPVAPTATGVAKAA